MSSTTTVLTPRPTLVLLPGLLCDAALWAAPMATLKERFHIIVPDLSRHDTIAGMAGHVLAQVSAPHFCLGALSMGGYVAFEIMRQAGHRVTRLALLDTSARPDTPEQRARRAGLIALSRSGKFRGVTPRLLPLLVTPDHARDPRITQTVFDMAERVGREGFQHQQHAIMERVDSRPSLTAITCPTLTIVGAQDQITPPEIVQEIAATIPHAQHETIDNCGHLPPLEQPEVTSKLLAAWFQAALS